jgi:hypothetical protein
MSQADHDHTTSKTTSRRAVLAGIAAAPAFAAPALASGAPAQWAQLPPEVQDIIRAFANSGPREPAYYHPDEIEEEPADPIFALIEQHRRLHADRERWLCENNDWENSPFCGPARALEDVLARTRPTTLAGVIAVMRYERETREGGYFVMGEELSGISPWLATLEQALGSIEGE